MKTTPLVPIVLFWAALSALHPPAAAADRGGDRVSFHAILIVASRQKGASDRRLAPYEPTLRRILRFESYRFISEDRGTVGIPGRGTLSLGGGHRVEFEAERSDRYNRRVRVRWMEGNRVLMDTGLSLRRGVPAVLGGPPCGEEGDVCAMIVIAR